MVWFSIFVHAILSVVGFCIFVASQLHLFDFTSLPPVHFKRSIEKEIKTKVGELG